MMQILYRTADPDHLELRATAEDFYKAEYRQLFWTHKVDENGITKPTFEPYQGWWDGTLKEPIFNRRLLSAFYETWQEAQTAYNEQLRQLRAQGYVHSFSKNPYSPNGELYENLT